jgi:uncharacterized membrane protein YhaH (DUF805 family)
VITLADSSPGASLGVVLGIAITYVLFALPLALVFKKTQVAPWYAFIPILNLYGLLKVAGRPGWWLLLYLIPIVGFVVTVIVYLDVAKSFGRGAGFTVGLVFLPIIFLAILGINDDRYRGPSAA